MDMKYSVVNEDVEISSGEIIFVGEDDGLRGFAKHGFVGERKRVLIVRSGSGSLKYSGDESIGVKGIFWFWVRMSQAISFLH